MLTILKLFGRSPFEPLKAHMDKIADCVYHLVKMYEALANNNEKEVLDLADLISHLEHQADLIKNDIRNHLPKSLFLPVDKSHLLELLSLQDGIADAAEDAAVLATLKPIVFLDTFKDEFFSFLQKNIETFDEVRLIINEMHDLLEASFGGAEAEKVSSFVDRVAYKEHEADLIQRQLLKKLFASENEMTYTTFHVWQRSIEAIGGISNLSERLALRVRRMLEIK